MARKSLRVSQEQLEKAKRAFERTGWTQQELATEVDLRTRQPVGNFLAGKTVDRKVFQEICFKLDLNWQEVADLEKDKRSNSPEVPQPQEQERKVSGNPDFVGRGKAIANTTSEEETREPLHLKLEPLTERVRTWQLEEESPDQQLDVLMEMTSDDPNFVGREEAIADLNSLVNKGAKVILIQAEGGIGKTTLAREWFERQGLKPLELRVGTTSQNIQSAEDWVRFTLRNDFKESPETNFLTMLEQLKSKLQHEKIGVFIDNLEPALKNGGLIEPDNNYYVELLTVLAHPTVQSITLITSREPLHEPGLAHQTVQNYPLEGLKSEAWQQYFDSRHISKNRDALREMHHAYGGNAEVMFILSGDIKKQSQGNLQIYWQENRNDLLRHPTLEKLVQRQFNKLKDDNPQAHKLLCRLGAYPDQDISYIPKIWLFCLLWDVPKQQRRRVIDELLDRSLVKVRNVSENEYYLHPVIREEAIKSLNLIEEANAQKLLLIKTEIEAILTSNQNLAQDLQTFLVQLKEKSNLVRVPCHPANVRAFYFSLFYDLTTARHIAGELGSTCEFEGVDENVFDYDLVYKRLYDLYLDLSLVSAFSCDSYREFIRELDWCIVDSDRDYKLQEQIQLFKDKLPKIEKNWERFLDDEDWQNKEQDWIEPLRKLVIDRRKLPLDWQFSDEQTKLLNQYYDANKMLVDCLNSDCEVSPETRSHIEDTLLLPITEIEKPKLED